MFRTIAAWLRKTDGMQAKSIARSGCCSKSLEIDEDVRVVPKEIKKRSGPRLGRADNQKIRLGRFHVVKCLPNPLAWKKYRVFHTCDHPIRKPS